MPNKLENSCHVGKVCNLCRVKTIRIVVSTVMDVLAKDYSKLDIGFVFKRFWINWFWDFYPMVLGGEPCDRRVSFTLCDDRYPTEN